MEPGKLTVYRTCVIGDIMDIMNYLPTQFAILILVPCLATLSGGATVTDL